MPDTTVVQVLHQALGDSQALTAMWRGQVEQLQPSLRAANDRQAALEIEVQRLMTELGEMHTAAARAATPTAAPTRRKATKTAPPEGG